MKWSNSRNPLQSTKHWATGTPGCLLWQEPFPAPSRWGGNKMISSHYIQWEEGWDIPYAVVLRLWNCSSAQWWAALRHRWSGGLQCFKIQSFGAEAGTGIVESFWGVIDSIAIFRNQSCCVSPAVGICDVKRGSYIQSYNLRLNHNRLQRNTGFQCIWEHAVSLMMLTADGFTLTNFE